MEPNTNLPGTPQPDLNNNPANSGRLTPNFTGESAFADKTASEDRFAGGPNPALGVPPFQSKPVAESVTPPAPAPMPSQAPDVMPSPSPSPISGAGPANEIPIPPPPPTPPLPPERPAPGVVNYGLGQTEQESRVSAGGTAAPLPPVPSTGSGQVPPPASFNIPTPPPPQPIIGNRPGAVTPPPGAGDVVIRTLGGDIESLRESGGLGTQAGPSMNPASPPRASSSPVSPAPAQGNGSASGVKTADSVNPRGFEGGPLFTPKDTTGMPMPKKTGPVSGKTLEVAGIGVVIIGILAAVYFFALPKLFPAPSKTTAPVVVSTTTPIAEKPTTPPFVHHSFFNSTTSVITANLTAFSAADLTSAINSINESTTTPAKTIKELQVTYNGDPVQTAQILSAILPQADASLSQYLNNDFTAFVYYDGTNAWPGYVFQLGGDYSTSTSIAVPGTSSLTPTSPASSSAATKPTPTETLSAMFESAIESATSSLSDLYLTSPGTLSSKTWINGSLPNKESVRFVRFSKSGTVFEYGWIGKYLILSTSYAGIVQAEGMLSGS
ncbi:MAG: hypothetical protein KGJ01_00960 [Patescibacteria group bacterium]|nr:hypothetical protein [Patescibacteria group bacterium]